MLKRFIWGLLILAIIIAASLIYRTCNESRAAVNSEKATIQTTKQ